MMIATFVEYDCLILIAEILCMVSFAVYCFFDSFSSKQTSYITYKYFNHRLLLYCTTSMYNVFCDKYLINKYTTKDTSK